MCLRVVSLAARLASGVEILAVSGASSGVVASELAAAFSGCGVGALWRAPPSKLFLSSA